VAETGRGWFSIEAGEGGDAALRAGDGICFFSGGKLLGTNINGVENGRIRPNRTEGIAPGTEILRNFDKRFNDALLAAEPERLLPVEMQLTTDAAGDADATAGTGGMSGNVTLTVRDISRGIEASAMLSGQFAPAEKPGMMAETIRRQLSKSGGTIFAVERVEIECAETLRKPAGHAASLPGDSSSLPFLTNSQLNALRREVLDKLAAILSLPRPAPHRHPEGGPCPTPSDPVATATNSLARAFYAAHGATLLPTTKELQDDFTGQCVMTTPYCLRRETGQCLKENPPYRGPLYLARGRLRYRLHFDCERCLMNIELV
jgi:putative protease